MTNKFYKALGICLLIVMLPIMIVSSVVALTVNKYEVKSEYGESTVLVYNAQNDSWTINNVPQRKYYQFEGIELEINGEVEKFLYDTESKTIVISDNKKADFKKAVSEQKAQISVAWSCDYDIRLYFGSEWFDYIIEEYRVVGAPVCFVNPTSLETFKLFDTIGYDTTSGAKNALVVKVSTNKGATWSENGIDLGFNPTASGDITLRQVIDILESKKVNITPEEDYVLSIMLFA